MTTDHSHHFDTEIFSDPNQLDFFGHPPISTKIYRHFPLAGSPSASEPETSEHGLYRICHDMRTALNAILGFSEIMTQKLHGPLGHPKYEEYAQHVRFSGQALLSVSDEVLGLAGRNAIAGGGHMQHA